MAAVANSNLRPHLRFAHSPRAFLRMRLWLWLPFERAANCFFGCPCSCHNLPVPPTCHFPQSSECLALPCLAVIFSRSGGALCGSCWQRLLDPAGPALEKGKAGDEEGVSPRRVVAASVRQLIRTNVSAFSADSSTRAHSQRALSATRETNKLSNHS